MIFRKPSNPFERIRYIIEAKLIIVPVVCVIPNVRVSSDLLLSQKIILVDLRQLGA